MSLRFPERLLDVGWLRPASKKEPEVAVAFGPRRDRPSFRHRHVESAHAFDRQCVGDAVDPEEASSRRDREHHDAGGFGLASAFFDFDSDSVSEDDLFERVVRGKAQRLRALPADRASSCFEDDDSRREICSRRRKARFGMDRPVDEADSPTRIRDDAAGRVEDRILVARRGHVHRLFEIGAVQRIRLVENGEHLEIAVNEERFDCDLITRHELFDQQRLVGSAPRLGGDGANGRGGAACLVSVVDAHDAPARRERGRFHYCRVADPSGGLDNTELFVVASLDHFEARLGDTVFFEQPPHRRLVPRRFDGRVGVLRESEPLGGGGGGKQTLVVDGDDGVEWCRRGEVRDDVGRRRGVTQGKDDEPAGEHSLHRLGGVRTRHHVDPEVVGGREERLGPIGRRRKDEEHSWHQTIMPGSQARADGAPGVGDGSYDGSVADELGDSMPEPVLRVTDSARAAILEARAAEQDPERLALFVEVTGEQNGIYTYEMWFEALADATPKDVRCEHDDLTVVVGGDSVDKIRGATLDSGEHGLVMLNPNTPAVAHPQQPIPEGDTTSPLARSVIAVLEEQINPQIAMHGGRADLVSVDDGVAYLRLSGGCQGCGLAALTLNQGISVAIREALPEITDVVDVTSHAEGTNPYFEPAKK